MLGDEVAADEVMSEIFSQRKSLMSSAQTSRMYPGGLYGRLSRVYHGGGDGFAREDNEAIARNTVRQCCRISYCRTFSLFLQYLIIYCF